MFEGHQRILRRVYHFSLTFIIRNNIKFYHSLVVSICDYIQHSSEGPRTLPFSEDTSEVTIQLDKETFPINPPEPDETQTLDLHTKTALIATNNLNITLQELGFREEAIDDCVDIYAVAREVETFREEDGMFSVYRYKKCWVCTGLLILI